MIKRNNLGLMFVGVLVVLVGAGSAWALDVLEPGYASEIYVSYSEAGILKPMSMAFDDNGNLYITQLGNHSIWRVTPERDVSEFAGGFHAIRGIVWGGGTGFGNFLYVVGSKETGAIYRVDMNGNSSKFATRYCASPLGLDRTGNYGGNLFTATSCQDHTYQINTNGGVSRFSNFPGWRDGGGPVDIGFDVMGDYGQLMYIGTSFNNDRGNQYMSGIFALDSNGSASRFTTELENTSRIDFDTTGNFGGKMFAIAVSQFGDDVSIWEVAPDGTATEFARKTSSYLIDLIFGSDGAMYVTEYEEATETVTISRISSGVLESLEIVGPNEVAENFSGQYKAIAYYEEGFTRDVSSSAVWSVEPGTSAGIDGSGLLTTGDVEIHREVVITAQYSEGGVDVEDDKVVLVQAICLSGSALDFDGGNDYVNCGNDLSLDVTELTWSLWIKRGETTYANERSLISNTGNENIGGTYALQIDNGGQYQDKIQFVRHGLPVSQCPLSNTAINDMNWHHIAVTRNSNGDVIIYIDGLEDATGNIPERTAYSQTMIGTGNSNYSNFKGTIDEVAIYNRPLSAEGIRALMHDRPGTGEAGLVGYWDFNEGEGQVAEDLSGNGNDGRLGSSSGEDDSDPGWASSDVPVGVCTLADIAVINIEEIRERKVRLLNEIDELLGQERFVSDVLNMMISNGDYDGLDHGDVVTAKQKLHAAGQHEKQAVKSLDRSIDKLDDSLAALNGEARSNRSDKNDGVAEVKLADIDGDGMINSIDFYILSQHWLESYHQEY